MAKWGKVAAIGVGLAGLSYMGQLGKNIIDPPEKETPWLDFLLDFTLGDPQADRTLVGQDLTFRDFLPIKAPVIQPLIDIAQFDPSRSMMQDSPFGNLYGLNATTISDSYLSQDWMSRVATRNVRQGFTNYPYPHSQYSFRPSVRRSNNLNVDGSIVFGMSNMRH